MNVKSYPKITIVTPNYNQAAYLEETILSVLNQNYPNLEYIIIDGGSTDGSVDIIEKYAASLAYWESVSDKGMYDAIQKGFVKSSGEIMAWINSDDMYMRNAFFSVAEIFSRFPAVNWLSGYPSLYDSQGRIVGCSHTLRQWSKYDYYAGNYRWIQQESVFWRRSLWEKAGSFIDTGLKYAGDFELWNRFFHYDKLYITTALLSGFRMRDDQQLSMKQKEKYEMEIATVLSSNNYSDEEKRIIKGYKNLKKRTGALSKISKLGTEIVLNKYRLRHFGYPPVICFNRDEQQFEM